MQQHAEIGHRILAGSDAPLLKLAAEIALTHHERVDGTGYPNGLTGESIPLAGRIAAIADVFDGLTTNRVYRAAFELVEAVDMMKAARGTHFDGRLLDTFLSILPEILRISEACSAASSASLKNR
jgi:putative two-component system response regulator